MIGARPLSLSIAGWLIVFVHALSALGGTAALLIPTVFEKSPYPVWLNVGFVMANIAAAFAGIQLLQMKKVAVWIYASLIVLAFGLLSAISGQYAPATVSRYIGGFVMLAIYAALTLPHWSKLTPQDTQPESLANA